MNHTIQYGRKYGALTLALAIGLMGGGVAGTGCGNGNDFCIADSDCNAGETCDIATGTCGCDSAAAIDTCTAANPKNFCDDATGRCVEGCLTDSDCRSGETCDTTSNKCGCTVGASPDSCTQADSTAVCHLDTERCETTCVNDDGCPADLKCDVSLSICRNPARFEDCTAVGASACPSDEVCDPTSARCIAKCPAALCGSDKACNDSGLCVPKCTTTAGPNACTSPDVCNTTSGLCETPTGPIACSPANAQPDVCAAGDFCSGTGSSGTCDVVNPGTCPNLTKYNEADFGTTGPTVYLLEQAAAWETSSSFCGGTATRVQIAVNAYTKTGTFPTDREQFRTNVLRYILESGATATGNQIPSITQSGYQLSNGNKNVRAVVNFCVPNTQNGLGVAFVMKDGNGLCGQFNR